MARKKVGELIKEARTGGVLSSILLDPGFMDSITGFFGREMPED